MRIAAAQIDIMYGQHQANLEKMLQILERTSSQGAKLTIFPECSLSGYCCETIEEARELALPVENNFSVEIQKRCETLGSYAVFGYLELGEDDHVFNSLSLVGPDGTCCTYRKTHLPTLGVDRFTCQGAADYQVHSIGDINVGLLICYDCSFPEPSRILALKGADLIILPTNWPSGARITAEVIPPARAMENHVYFAAVNRVGVERGFEFVGKSRICHADGTNLAYADHDQEETLYATIDPEVARAKRLIRVPGKHEIDLFADRRPDLYHPLCD